MDVIILAGGRGERLGKLTKGRNKCLLEVLPGWNLIDFSISNALKLENSTVYIVIGYKGEDVEETVSERWSNDRIQFRWQEVNTAIGAICSVKKDIKEKFLLMLADEVLLNNNLPSMVQYSQENDCGIIGYVWEDNPNSIKKTYSIELNPKGSIFKLVEKPKAVNTKFKGTGNCILPKQFFEWANYVQDYGVQDFVTCVQYGIEQGFVFRPFLVCQKYFNVNTLSEYYTLKKFMSEENR